MWPSVWCGRSTCDTNLTACCIEMQGEVKLHSMIDHRQRSHSLPEVSFACYTLACCNYDHSRGILTLWWVRPSIRQVVDADRRADPMLSSFPHGVLSPS